MTDLSSETILSMMPSIGPVSSLLAPELLSTMTMTSVSDAELNGILEEIGFFDEYNEENMMLPTTGVTTPCETPPPSVSSSELSFAPDTCSEEEQAGATNTQYGSSFIPVSPDHRSTDSPQPYMSSSSSDAYTSSCMMTSYNTYIAPKPSMASSMSVVSVSSTGAPSSSSTASLMAPTMNYGYCDAAHSPSSQGGVVSPTGSSMRAVFNPLQVTSSLHNLPEQALPLMPATAALAAALAASSSSSSNNNGGGSSLPPSMAWPSSISMATTTDQGRVDHTTNDSRKRKLVSSTTVSVARNGAATVGCSSISNTTISSLGGAGDDRFLSEDELEARRERNRVHAKKSRLRKKSLTGTLQDSLADLKEENAKLREMVYAKIGKQATNDILERRILDSHSKFISALTDPAHRVVDTKTISFLKGLRKGIHKAPSSAA